MKTGSAWLSVLVACSAYLLCAGGGLAQSGGQTAPQLRMYTSSEIAMTGYDVVAHLPADSWRTAFRLPTFSNREEAVAALQNEAAQRGADALLNVGCLDQGRGRWGWSNEPAFLCYGVAIRVRTG